MAKSLNLQFLPFFMAHIDEFHAESLLTAMVQVWKNIEQKYYTTEEDIQDMALMVEKTLLPKFNQIIEAENLKAWIAANRVLVLSAQAALVNAQDYFVKKGLIPKAQAVLPVPAVEIKSIVVTLGIIASAGVSADQAMKRASLIEQQPAGQRAHFTTMENIRHDLDNYLSLYNRYSTELMEILESPEIEDIKAKAQKEFIAAVDALRRLAAWTHSLIALGVKPHSETEKSEFMRMESAVANELKKKKVAV
jgi:hypothetical protein